MQLSRFNVHVPLADRNEVFLMNTFSDAQLVASNEVSGLLARIARGDSAFNPEELDTIETLVENGFVVGSREDESAAISTYFQDLREDTEQLRVTVLTTLQCNFACDYCFQGDHGDYNKFAEKMSLETARDVVGWIEKRLDEIHPEKFVLTLFGGEPLLNLPVAYYLAEQCHALCTARGVEPGISLITNGLLLTPEVVNRLVPCGLYGVKITLDGDRDTHNRMRPLRGRQGTFDRIIENVRQVAHLVPITVGGNFGDNGFALVVTNEGQLLAHGNPTAKSRVARGDDLNDHPLVARIAAAAPGEQAASAEYSDERGPMLGVAARLAPLGWTVIVEQPRSEAFAIPIYLQWQLGIAIAIALMVMLGVGYVFGYRFIDPILALTRGTRALAEGRLNERVAVESKDEIGQLGLAFNNMADRLVELQEDVRKKERQAMFGRISIGLVHDLSHPIQNIGNSCKLIIKMFDDEEYRETFKRTIERELAQVKRVLDDLRNVARPIPLQMFPIDTNKGLADLVESMQTTAETAGLRIEQELVLGPLYIDADLYALNRVYRNLITNSLQATPPSGSVVVRSTRDANHAVIEVADTGYGIPKERIETIFEDFVTTKRRGLGLGLAISKKIVEQLGGTISVQSEVGVGTTFTLRFPLTKARPSRLEAV